MSPMHSQLFSYLFLNISVMFLLSIFAVHTYVYDDRKLSVYKYKYKYTSKYA